jgi:hypothetical protein
MFTNLTRSLTTILLLCALSAAILGQEKRSAQKDALINELYTLSGLGEKDDLSRKEMNDAIDEAYPAKERNKKMIERLWQAYSDDPEFKRFNAKQQEAFKKHLDESSDRIRNRYSELIDQKGLNSKKATEQLFYSIIDKIFTEDELKGLVAFYSSPAVKKSRSEPSSQLSEAEFKEITGFYNTPLGMKFMSRLFDEFANEAAKIENELLNEVKAEEIKLFLQKQKQ